MSSGVSQPAVRGAPTRPEWKPRGRSEDPPSACTSHRRSLGRCWVRPSVARTGSRRPRVDSAVRDAPRTRPTAMLGSPKTSGKEGRTCPCSTAERSSGRSPGTGCSDAVRGSGESRTRPDPSTPCLGPITAETSIASAPRGARAPRTFRREVLDPADPSGCTETNVPPGHGFRFGIGVSSDTRPCTCRLGLRHRSLW